jgi:transcriptional regulator with XRE-family HTH domain
MRRLGVEASTERVALGWTQLEVAQRAGVSQASVARLEAGDPRLGLAIVAAIFAALGLNLSLKAYPGESVQLRDTAQLGMAEWIRLQAHHSLTLSLEVPTGLGLQAADMLLLGPARGLHLELETGLPDFQAALRRGQLKRDALQQRLGMPLAFVLALKDSERNRRAVQAHSALIATALPAGSREVMEAIRYGRPLMRDGLLWVRPVGRSAYSEVNGRPRKDDHA